MNRLTMLPVTLWSVVACAQLQDAGVAGDWRTPDRAVVRVAPCGTDICATLVSLGPEVRVKVDAQNPDPSKRGQKLCGLQIGYGFHLTDPAHAEDGHLYDPKSGKTYRGTMVSTAGQLSLRGYVGLKAFGRTETWTRASKSAESCN